LALALGGCASISIDPETHLATRHKPEHVYVAAFSTAGSEFNVDRDGEELREFKIDLQTMMTTAITVDLTKRLIPADAEGHVRHMHKNAWLITGHFTRVNQGSRLLRGAIGFGLGATKLETRIEVYDLSTDSDEPFLTFTTTGGSNAEPGAITAIATDPLTILLSAIAGGAGNVAHGLTEDTSRTAREITAELSDYMYLHGWIPADKWIKPKMYNKD